MGDDLNCYEAECDMKTVLISLIILGCCHILGICSVLFSNWGWKQVRNWITFYEIISSNGPQCLQRWSAQIGFEKIELSVKFIEKKIVFFFHPSVYGYCIAQYDFSGLRAEGLLFKHGDIITKIGEAPVNWWIGKLRGRRWIFPSNYVQK